jgi:hypothetical protein
MSLHGFSADAPATDVHVGIYVNRIYDFNLKDGQYVSDFYIWFRWKGNHVNPMDAFEIANGKIESKDGVTKSVSKGFNYAFARITARIFQNFNTRKYPFDSHSLSIRIEDNENEIHKLRYIPDLENSNISKAISLSGYKIDGIHSELLKKEYKTNFGDLELPTDHNSIYSQFQFNIKISRPDYSYFVKLYWGVVISALVAMLSFFIKPTDLDPRFGLGIGALFALMANIFIISDTLPTKGHMSIADKLNMSAVVVICFALVIATVSLKLYTAGKELVSQRLDKASFLFIFFAYFLGSYYIILKG